MIDGGVRLNDDLLNNVVCDSEKTTCFVDGESVVTSSLLKNTTINDYDLKFQGIKDFLGKPICLVVYFGVLHQVLIQIFFIQILALYLLQ